jgi:hypothetical protein
MRIEAQGVVMLFGGVDQPSALKSRPFVATYSVRPAARAAGGATLSDATDVTTRATSIRNRTRAGMQSSLPANEGQSSHHRSPLRGPNLPLLSSAPASAI